MTNKRQAEVLADEEMEEDEGESEDQDQKSFCSSDQNCARNEFCAWRSCVKEKNFRHKPPRLCSRVSNRTWTTLDRKFSIKPFTLGFGLFQFRPLRFRLVSQSLPAIERLPRRKLSLF